MFNTNTYDFIKCVKSCKFDLTFVCMYDFQKSASFLRLFFTTSMLGSFLPNRLFVVPWAFRISISYNLPCIC